PLYYVDTPQGIAFASEVRTLLETGVAERKLSLEGLASYFTLGSVREPYTILRDVRSLPGGHTLRYENGKSAIVSYWKLPLRQEQRISRTDTVPRLRQ